MKITLYNSIYLPIVYLHLRIYLYIAVQKRLHITPFMHNADGIMILYADHPQRERSRQMRRWLT